MCKKILALFSVVYFCQEAFLSRRAGRAGVFGEKSLLALTFSRLKCEKAFVSVLYLTDFERYVEKYRPLKRSMIVVFEF